MTNFDKAYSPLVKKLYKVDYNADPLDEKMSEISDGISVIIPTYNRCLFQEDGRDPLMWCISSIKQQRLENLETIIVDDASTDLTYMKMKQLQDKNLKYVRNVKREGSSMSRNIGARLASNELVLFLDDDCIFLSKDAVAIAAYSFKETEKDLEQNIAAIHLPVYYRSNRLKDVLPMKEILGIDYENGHAYCSTNSFPKERKELKRDDYLKGTEILKPLEINSLAGAFLSKRKAFLAVGGFSNFFPKPAMGEEHELAHKFTKNNYKLFFTPEPKSAVLHFKYGRQDKEPVVPFIPLSENVIELPLSLEEMLEESRTIRENTGNAATVEQCMYSHVFGRLMVFNGNDLGKRRFIQRVKEDIIDKNRYAFFNQKISDRALRERICLDAISAAEIKYNTLDTIPTIDLS